MNIFKQISNYIREKRCERLESDLNFMRNKFTFNPWNVRVPQALLSSENSIDKLTEYLVWYSGDSNAIYEYHQNYDGYRAGGRSINSLTNRFWTCCPIGERHVHSGLPALIAEKQATILFGPGVFFNANVYKKDANNNVLRVVDKNASKDATEMLNNILSDDKVHISELLECAAGANCWSGHIAVKASFDLSLTGYPILECFDRRFFDVIKQRGITTAIDFKTYYEIPTANDKDKFDKYLLHEIYTTSQRGNALIKYSLEKVKKEFGEKEEYVEVALTEIHQTANLPQEYEFKTVKGMLAWDLPNLVKGKAIYDDYYGSSDYAKATDSFDALDEIVSTLVAECAENKTIRNIPETKWPKDENGNFVKLNKYIRNFVKVQSDVDQSASNDITCNVLPDKTEEHYEKYKILIGQCCADCGISPISLGIPGLESIDSSAESQAQRVKTTCETRVKKLRLWKPFLEKICKQVLCMLCEIQSYDSYIAPDDGVSISNLDLSNLDVKVDFGDLIKNSEAEKITSWATAKSSGIASVEMAVKKIHRGDLNEEEMQDEINRIKLEQGMTVDDPNFLQLDLKDKEPPTAEEDEEKKPKVEDKNKE